jgi:predicted metal-dependent phosphoesterase TrpH
MVRVEFHCHTIYSKDSLTQPQNLINTCRRKGIHKVVITDHNTIQGAEIAQQIAPDLVIIGEEIMTTEGELLAFFLSEEIPAGLSPQETLDRLRAQEAFVSVSHPFDHLRAGHWHPEHLRSIVPDLDAIEVFNARCIRSSFNEQAQEFAQEHKLPGTVGSDAHAAFELGQASMLLPDFQNAADLRAVIHQGQPELKISGPWVRLVSRYAVLYKKLFNPTY